MTDRAALVVARDRAYAAWKDADARWADDRLPLYVAYLEANHALHRHDSPALVALIEPAPWTQPEPDDPRPDDAEECDYPRPRR